MPGLVTNGNVVLILERIEEMLKLSVATGTKHTALCCLCYILKSGLTEVAYLMQTWIGAGVRAVEEKAVISDVYHNLFLKQVHIYILLSSALHKQTLSEATTSLLQRAVSVLRLARPLGGLRSRLEEEE